MKSSYRLILFALVLLMILCGVNIYIALRNQKQSSQNLNTAITMYRQKDIAYTTQAIRQAVQTIQVKNGVDGKDGKDGVNGTNGKDGTTSIVHEYTQPEPAKNGSDGKNGKDARQIILSTDPDTGDIMWKYQGDTLWNLLIEKCSLTNACQE